MDFEEQSRIDRALGAYKTLGISVDRWIELTGYSRDQYYKWHNKNVTTQPTTEQAINVCLRLGINPGYVILGIGPIELDQAIHEGELRNRMQENRGNILLALDKIDKLTDGVNDLRDKMDRLHHLAGEVKDLRNKMNMHNAMVEMLLLRIDKLLEPMDQRTESKLRG